MNARSRRIKQWVIWLVIAALCFGIPKVSEYVNSLPERQPLTVYAPADMEEAFNHALNMSALSGSHYIVMSDDPNSNICVGCGKQDDASYEKLAYSPFVVAYHKDESYFKKLKKADVCFESTYDSNYYEIDFLKIIDEAIGEGKWENLGITKQGNLKVFYPDKESVYWSDFYDFLLVTLNDGKYPTTQAEVERAEETIDKFVNSKNTEGVIDFEEQGKRTAGFPSTVIYILPEKDAREIRDNEQVYARFLYPTKTVYVNYYVKGDELGKQVIEAFDKTSFLYDFYRTLATEYYRNDAQTELNDNSNILGDGSVFNVARIPEKREFATTPTTPETSESPTSE